MTRKSTLALAAVLLLTVHATVAAAPLFPAIPVHDVAHTVQTIAHFFERLTEVRQKWIQIEQQLRQIDLQVVALKKLEGPNWRSVDPLLAQLDDLIRQGQALAYSLRDIDRQFRATFPGWEEYRDAPAEHRDQATRALDSMRTALNAVARQARDLVHSPATLAAIKSQVAEVEGHEEMLELQATLAAYTAEELLLLRQALATATNVQTVYYGYRLNREAQAEATHRGVLERTLEAPKTGSRGFTFRPGWWPF